MPLDLAIFPPGRSFACSSGENSLFVYNLQAIQTRIVIVLYVPQSLFILIKGRGKEGLYLQFSTTPSKDYNNSQDDYGMQCRIQPPGGPRGPYHLIDVGADIPARRFQIFARPLHRRTRTPAQLRHVPRHQAYTLAISRRSLLGLECLCSKNVEGLSLILLLLLFEYLGILFDISWFDIRILLWTEEGAGAHVTSQSCYIHVPLLLLLFV